MKQAFTIYPAIDLRKGNVVRLQFGDPNLQTTYGSNPVDFAATWLEKGAKWLHLINLDAAFGEDDTANRTVIREIAQTFGDQIKIQTGGGIRSLENINTMLETGVSRVILGTAAVENPDLVSAAIKQFGARQIVVGVDARDGLVRTKGWTEASALSPLDFALQLENRGVKTVIFTDISRDGSGLGINLEQTLALSTATNLEIIASGGIHSLNDVLTVKHSGLPGVVIGKALYDKRINPDQLFQNQEGESC